MIRRLSITLCIAVLFSFLSACGGGSGGDSSTPTNVSGAAQKGPFLQGSSVFVNILDNYGNASDLTIVSQTDDSIGDFSFTTHHKGPVQILVSGYYFNEISGALSDGPLTLRGVFNITANAEQSAYVNILTHLINDRVLSLIADNPHLTVEEAISLAQGELQAALAPILSNESISDFSKLSLYDLEGTDTANNGYLLVVSAAFCQAAIDRANANSSSVTSELTLLLNSFADDLAQDGVIDTTLITEILQPAVTQLDPMAIIQNLGNHSEDVLSIKLATPDISNFVETDPPGSTCGDSSLTFPAFTSDMAITHLNPESGQANVPTDASITIGLNKTPEMYSWGPSDILVIGSDGTEVTFTPLSPDASTIVLDPVFPLQPNSCYTVRLDTSLIFNADERLLQPFEWSFGTGPLPNVTISSHQNGDILAGLTQLAGSHSDAVSRIAITTKTSPPLSGNALLEANGDWLFAFDSIQFSDGGVTILIEGFDLQGESIGTTELNLLVNNSSSANGWVPEQIGTSNTFLYGVEGIGHSVFALGENATALEFNGNQWSLLDPTWPNSGDLFGAWGLSSDDYYFVGGGAFTTGAILHNQSSQWTNEKSGGFSKTWGTSSDNVYTIGSSGVFHYDGTAWNAVDVGYSAYHYRGIWGTAPDDIYIAGFAGPDNVILHYDGSTWTNMLEGTGFSGLYIHELWGTASDNIYAVGTGKQILHYDGTSWQSIDTGLELLPLYGIWGFGADDIYAIGSVYYNDNLFHSIIYHFDGLQWTEDKVLNGVSLYDIWGSATAGIFTVGGMGQDRQGVAYHLVN